MIISLNEILFSDISDLHHEAIWMLDLSILEVTLNVLQKYFQACNFNLVVLNIRSSSSLTFSAIFAHLDSVILSSLSNT